MAAPRPSPQSPPLPSPDSAIQGGKPLLRIYEQLAVVWAFAASRTLQRLVAAYDWLLGRGAAPEAAYEAAREALEHEEQRRLGSERRLGFHCLAVEGGWAPTLARQLPGLGGLLTVALLLAR